ncbi:MAG TPA: amino acid permease [Gaiellales bacterium]|nr:amino acid permease [Gaiellales bacterium]
MNASGRGFKRTLVGRRMPMGSLEDELLPRWIALPIFASDPLSSVAYATEAALVVLVATSVASRGLIVPISAVIAALLAVVVLSYRQTIFAYPKGGGSYVVAKENLGQMAGLVAAASLLIDYVLTAAVSIASGVLAVTSAVPELSTHAVELSLGVLLVLVLVNLRGVRESGFVFALPTYGFIIAIGATIAVGFVRGLMFGWPTAHVPDPAHAGLAASVGIVVLLRAFASGCSALTGVEAISNGVTAFRRPQARNAASTLMWMGVVAIILFLGVSILAWKLDARPSGSVSVLSEIARAVFPSGGSSFGYYAVQATTAGVLALAANTAFQGFPRLAALLAADSFVPRQFSNLGDRLVYSNGILVLALAAGALIVGFHADVNNLIHLYLLGVFTAFTLSQFGMVRHNWGRRVSGGSRSSLAYKIGLNATGGLFTCLVGAIVIATKFGEGAWMVVIAIPVLVLGFTVVGRHYADVRTRLRDPGGDYAVVRGPVVLFVSALDDATAEALRYVRGIAGDRFQAIHVADPAGVSGIAKAWRGFSGEGPPLLTLPRERTVSGTVARYVRELDHAAGEVTTLVVPELFKRRSLVAILRGRTTLALRLRLQGEEDVVLADVPVVADAHGLRPAPAAEQKTTVLLPISELNAASRHALGYALGLGADNVFALHVELGADDVSQTRAAWAARALPVPVKVVASPYRDLGQPLLAEIRAVTADPTAVCVVVMPEIISPHRWQRILHNQRALFIKRLLLFEERVVLTSVPYRLPPPGERAPAAGDLALRAPERSREVLAAPTAARAPGVAVERAASNRTVPVERFSTDAIWRTFEGFAGSMALLAATLVCLLALRHHLSVETVALVLLLPPLVAAISGRALALVMAAFGALLFNFFFLRPYYTLSIGTGRGIAAFLVYSVVALVVAVVAGRLREARAEADRRIRQEQLLHDVALDLLAGRSRDDVLRRHLQRIADAIGVDAAATSDGTRAIVAGDATPALLRAELPSARYHAATFGDHGRVVIDGGLRLTRAQTQLIDTFARLLDGERDIKGQTPSVPLPGHSGSGP